VLACAVRLLDRGFFRIGIDPRVFDRFNDGVTIAGALDRLGEGLDLGQPSFQGAIEEAVLDLIEEEPSPAIEKVA